MSKYCPILYICKIYVNIKLRIGIEIVFAVPLLTWLACLLGLYGFFFGLKHLV